MGLKLKEKFYNLFISNKVESIETRQIEVQQDNRTTQEHFGDDSALLLTFRLSQFLGIQPVYITKRTSKIFYISISPVVYVLNIVITLFINGIVLHGMFLTLTNEDHEMVKSKNTRFKDTDNLIVLSFIFFISLFNIFNTLYGIIRVRGILDCLEYIKKIKYSIYNGSYQCLENRRKMCCIILFATFSPIILKFTIIGFSLEFSEFYQYGTAIQTVTVILLEVPFLLLVESLNSSYEAINMQLKEILSHLKFYSRYLQQLFDMELKVFWLQTSLYPCQHIERIHRTKMSLRICHLMNSFVDSCNVMKKINKNESLLLLCHVILFPLYIIISLNFLFQELLSFVESTSTLYSVCQEVSNCFNNMFFIRFIIQPCYQIQKKVNETKHLIAEIMCHIKSEDDPLFDSVDIFYKQLLLNHYVLTVMGVSDIGRPLIAKIFGLSSTLLMVIKF